MTSTVKSIFSLFLIVTTLLVIVFVKMESRRLGYAIFKKSRLERSLIDDQRELEMQLASLTRPGRIEHLAERHLDLKKAKHSQVVQLFASENNTQALIYRVQ